MKKIILIIFGLALINLVSASTCPNGVTNCNPNLPFQNPTPTSGSNINNTTIVRSGNFNCTGTNVLQNYTINSSGAFGQCIAQSGGSMDYTNIALTNKTNNFTENQIFDKNASFIGDKLKIETRPVLYGCSAQILMTGGTKLCEQRSSPEGSDRFLYLPNGDDMEVLTEDGSSFMMSIKKLKIQSYVNGVSKSELNGSGYFVKTPIKILNTINATGNIYGENNIQIEGNFLYEGSPIMSIANDGITHTLSSEPGIWLGDSSGDSGVISSISGAYTNTKITNNMYWDITASAHTLMNASSEGWNLEMDGGNGFGSGSFNVMHLEPIGSTLEYPFRIIYENMGTYYFGTYFNTGGSGLDHTDFNGGYATGGTTIDINGVSTNKITSTGGVDPKYVSYEAVSRDEMQLMETDMKNQDVAYYINKDNKHMEKWDLSSGDILDTEDNKIVGNMKSLGKKKEGYFLNYSDITYYKLVNKTIQVNKTISNLVDLKSKAKASLYDTKTINNTIKINSTCYEENPTGESIAVLCEKTINQGTKQIQVLKDNYYFNKTDGNYYEKVNVTVDKIIKSPIRVDINEAVK